MELQSRDAPLPPVFAAVRRRHPDVDIVLLPPERPSAEPVGQAMPATEQRLANAFDLTTGTATRAWAEAVGDGQLPDSRFAFGPDETTVTVRARVSARLDASPLVLLAAALAPSGWEIGQRPGDVSQLCAHRATMQLVASYAAASGAFVLTASSTPLAVGGDRAVLADEGAARAAAYQVELDRRITDLMAEEAAVPAVDALDSTPGPGAPTREVNRWWDALSRDQQLSIVAASPGSIGNRDGIPPWARDAANRVALDRDLAGWGSLEDQGLLSDVERQWLANARAAQDAVAAIERGIDPQTLDDVTSQLYLYDPTAGDGDGAVAVAAGDLATARDVAVTVPGDGADARSAPFQADRVLDLYEATRCVDGTGVATLCWMGYGADRLADLVDGLVHGPGDSRDGDLAHLTVIDVGEHSKAFDHGSRSLDDLSQIVSGNRAAG